MVVVAPSGKTRQVRWNTLTADECDLSLYRPGDALGMVGGHGLDVVDVDTKNGGAVEHLPPFKHYGVTRTPSGGAHYLVPSSGLGKITPLDTEAGHVGDYVGGRPDGTGRLLAYLPGSARAKYPGGEYVEEEPWRIEDCLAAEPDPDLLSALESAGGSREATTEHYVYTGPDRDPSAGRHWYARQLVERNLARLDACDVLGYRGEYWDNTTYKVANRLVEIGNSGWTGYDLLELKDEFLAHAPTDDGFGPRQHEAKWESALKTTGPNGIRSPEDIFGEDESGPFDVVWGASQRLADIRTIAHSRMLSAVALLAYVLGRVLAETPPRVMLPAVIGTKASLNFGVAVVGGSGTGKSSLVGTSDALVVDWFGIARNLGSGEGIAQTFLTGGKTNGLIDYPHRILLVDEIDSLAATKDRKGATIGPALRSALTGGTLGQENATVTLRRHVPAGAYRLVVFLGVQPTRSRALLEDEDAGTPQRLLWVRATDPTVPDHPPAWPSTWTEWEPPANPPDEIEYPESVKAEVRAARLRQARGQGDPREGHRLLLQLKVGAALALLHGEVYISEQWWEVAGVLVAESMAVQGEARSVTSAETVKESRNRGRLDAIREQGAADVRAERVTKAAKTIARLVAQHAAGPDRVANQKHDPSEGCTDRCITGALRNYNGKADLRGPALDEAEENDWVRNVGDRWYPGTAKA